MSTNKGSNFVLTNSLRKAFSLLDAGLVSIVGAGGKTTLMFRLANELANEGKTVLTTTTTKIYPPTQEQSRAVFVGSDPQKLLKDADRLYPNEHHITAAADYDGASGKLLRYPLESIRVFWESRRFEWILIEADGAAGRSLKAPADHEPVIPAETTTLVSVVGLDAVYKRICADWVFRPHLFAHLSGLSIGKTVTPRSICSVLTHPMGIMKGCPAQADRFLFLNKAHTITRKAAGREVARKLRMTGKSQLKDVLMGSLKDQSSAIDSLFHIPM
jgi:probable selenium-dependent hydroxylase accessory protein YqeC